MIYLDNSATTRVLDIAASTANKYMTELFYNPSAAYIAAVEVETNIKSARVRMASALDCSADEIIFTSGGTESNNAAILGTVKNARGYGRIICSAVEHSSVFEVFKLLGTMGYDAKIAPVLQNGSLDMNAFYDLLTPDTQLVSIMHVNNETGAINDLHACRTAIQELSPGAIFHSDGVQAFCKLPFSNPPCDIYSVSGHKFHSPKGIGALYIRKGINFFGSLIGGGQEKGLRSGTTNTPGIMGMDAALGYYMSNQAQMIALMRENKTRLAKILLHTIPDTTVNGPDYTEGSPHILNISFAGMRSEVLLHSLAEKGIFISIGSACSSRKKGNRILDAMGIPDARKESAVRLSLCPFTTPAEIDIACNAIIETVSKLRRFKRR